MAQDQPILPRTTRNTRRGSISRHQFSICSRAAPLGTRTHRVGQALTEQGFSPEQKGVNYEEGAVSIPIGSHWVHLEIEGGRAVALRLEEIDDSDPSCWMREGGYRTRLMKVDW